MFSSDEITGLLIDWGNGRQEALEKLLPLVEKELHRLAHRHMRRMQPGNTLQTTALINETYIRLVDQKKVQWQNRAHFFGIAAQMMRRVLLNYIRDQKRLKRGGDAVHVSFSESAVISQEKSEEILALEEALCRLASFDERRSRVVELKYFGGLNVEEIAEVLKISKITVTRDWNFAKAWLAREIRNGT
ncbi:MAG: sigma-70 family RNA polymerase sigma factor [Acidobacteriota bacterium]|nr:sigma-70 family RNA polymerase sigma factor [Acidobacteriota bacterium]